MSLKICRTPPYQAWVWLCSCGHVNALAYENEEDGGEAMNIQFCPSCNARSFVDDIPESADESVRRAVAKQGW